MTDTLKMAREALANFTEGCSTAVDAAAVARAAIAAIDARQAATVGAPSADPVVHPAWPSFAARYRAKPEALDAARYPMLCSSWRDWRDGFNAATQPAVQAPAPLTETEIEFGLNNELEDPSDDEATGFRRGVRWAEVRHGVGAAAQGGEHVE